MPVLPFRTDDHIARALPATVAHLAGSRVLGHPTETIYGLGCALTAAALERLSDLKARDDAKPFITLVAGIGMLATLGTTLGGAAATLAGRFWPGPLTLVLRSTRVLPAGLARADGAVAVRWTSHAGLQRLITALGAPMTSTSANRPGLPPAATAAEIVSHWPAQSRSGLLLVLDGGPGGARPPSTIVDCTDGVPRVTREGAVSVGELREVVPDVVRDE